jgi:hypothetical protein
MWVEKRRQQNFGAETIVKFPLGTQGRLKDNIKTELTDIKNL